MVRVPDEVVALEGHAPGGAAESRSAEGSRWLVLGLCAVALVAWLVLRPSQPGGAAAVVDLLVLPAVLFLEVRVVAGRPRLTPGTLAVFFGLGAVLAAVTSLLVERAVGFALGSSAVPGVGPLAEAVATCAPVAVAALLAGRHAWSVADTTLAALASGSGFLVVHTALATAAIHAGPDYVSPLLAGYHWVPPSAGSPTTYFAGHALAAALVGAALGLGLRFRSRLWQLVPAAGALALVVFDHQLFDWRLRHLVASRPARTSGLVDVVQRVTLEGRLALVLLAGGLVVARLTDRPSPPPAGEVLPVADASDGHRVIDLTDTAATDAPVEPPGAVDPDPDPHEARTTLVAWVPLAVAVAAGVTLVVLARGRHLGVVDHRGVAVSVSVLGLIYGLWHLPDVRAPATGVDLRAVLAAGAVLSSGIGVMAALLPEPRAVVPAHGGLFLATVLGWGAHVGNVGVVLGLGGLATPQGEPGRRLFGDAWGGIVRHRLAWTGLFGHPGATRRGRGGDRLLRGRERGRTGRRRPADRRSGHGAEFLWFKVANSRWARVLGRRGARYKAGDDAVLVGERAVAVAIEPIHDRPGEQLEFVGATVKEALEAAMRHVGADLAHSSLQLVDNGRLPRRGKPGTGQPARVRVTESRPDGDEALSPPARDSITRSTRFAVVVRLSVDEGQDPPDSVTVTLRSSVRGSRALTCALVETSSGTATYRSNPYSVEAGEDATLAEPGSDGMTAGGLRVEDGDDVTVEFRGESTEVTVYDGWATQVLGVNRHLFDLAEEHHRRVVDVLEEEIERIERTGRDAQGVRRCVQRLRARLASVDEGRRLLSTPGDDVERAFTSTAVLHAATSVEDDDGVLDAAVRTLGEPVAGPSPDPVRAAFCEFLRGTGPGRLWADGAYSVHDVARLLRWERFAEDPAGGTQPPGRSVPPVRTDGDERPPDRPPSTET